MKFPRPYTLKEISNSIGRQYVGDDDFLIEGINEIHRVQKGEIVFVDHPKYYDKALNSNASIILIDKIVDCPEDKCLIISEDPFSDFNKITSFFRPFLPANTSISDSAEIGEGTTIQPNAFIGNNVKIGENCIIHSNVSIYDNCEIGNNVIIHSGTVLGGDGFYYKTRKEKYDKFHSVGNVIVEDDVEIGCNCTIDRGVTDSTIIGKGSKLDNLIQIGHEVIIGEKCLIASQVGIAGCVTVEDNVTIWGQVGIRSDIKIEKNAVVLAQAGVSKDLKGGVVYWGTPAEPVREHNKKLILLKNLPKLIEEIKNKF
ncbi:MAG: UDP-3-O-(3-hydroxymyristoyl)glucosamine N-acyltransferase [Flavobacteriales bacterium]|nr:UDP-3-O-(3-hydroxymyristoyl)glucosamine N-acyltransferase [Flavobacteriales bacterium]